MTLIIYTKQNCPWCEEALHFLNVAGIEYEEREVRHNPDFMKEMEQKSGQTKAPTLDLDGEILADADVSAIEVFLKEKKII
jgi:glutaredoxin